MKIHNPIIDAQPAFRPVVKETSNGLIWKQQSFGLLLWCLLCPYSHGAEWSATLLPGSWTEITDTGTPPQHTFSVPVAENTNLYMRLKVTMP